MLVLCRSPVQGRFKKYSGLTLKYASEPKQEVEQVLNAQVPELSVNVTELDQFKRGDRLNRHHQPQVLSHN